MFVMTMNRSGLKKLAVVGACALALAAGAVGLSLMDNGDAVETAALPAAAAGQQIGGAEDLRAFLAGYGLEVDPTSARVSTVEVPRKWDDDFKAFAEVVQQSGLALKKCRGKEVDKWMVPLPAQSTESASVYAVVLVQEGQPRGAYLLEEPSGEVRPLTPAAGTAAQSTAPQSAAQSAAAQDTVLAAAQSAAAAAAQSEAPAQAAAGADAAAAAGAVPVE